MTKRIVDINGKMVTYPKHYHDVLNLAYKMIGEMESDNVDRSDMRVVLKYLMSEIEFEVTFLPDRTNK